MDVLLVEDEPLVREMLSEDLLDAGLAATCVESAEAGLSAAERDGPPVVLVTDVNLGPGMNGLQLVVEARRRWPQLAVVLMSGDERNFAHPFTRQFNSCFLKPFNPPKLVSAVNTLMGRPAQ